MDKKTMKKDIEYVEEKPGWISQENNELLVKQWFGKILSFYIINTPDAGKSVRGKRIDEYGIEINELTKYI